MKIAILTANTNVYREQEEDKAEPQEESKPEENTNPDNTIETPEEDKAQE